MIKVLSVFGTRPEAIKMTPVARELEKRADHVVSKDCVAARSESILRDEKSDRVAIARAILYHSLESL